MCGCVGSECPSIRWDIYGANSAGIMVVEHSGAVRYSHFLDASLVNRSAQGSLDCQLCVQDILDPSHLAGGCCDAGR